ncbi:hypothetical protein CBR_g17105 [Chara braunii]|uniref:CCHC-type domain-containing protein n=1 Tax=Chara braunii TaxID=69332 RepID=A0A388KUM2_CHABU|nr:hypothetical protein CBR_g17105 [Chara braunii]|eukprot:GBG73765.1 hypothetical protein CBR_g17105 [Chara braunii]
MHVRTCYNCGSPDHLCRECPHRGFGRPPATGANSTPLANQPLLALPPPSSSSSFAVTNNYSNGATPAAAAPTFPEQQFNQSRTNWWKVDQEKLDRCHARTVADEEREAKTKLEEEKIKKFKEEEDRKEEWRKERARLEEEMGARLDKRPEKVYPHLINKDDGMVSPNEELVQLKKENEKLRRLLRGDDNHGDEVAAGDCGLVEASCQEEVGGG